MTTQNITFTAPRKKYIATGLTPSAQRSNSAHSASLESVEYATALLRPDGGEFTQLAEAERQGKRGIKPSAGAVIETDAFKAWFAGSTVLDTDGRPLVVFHGTSFPGKRFISRGKGAYAQLGHWFDAEPSSVHGYALAKEQAHCSNLLPVYLSIKNPKRYPDIEHMKDDANGKYGGVFGARVQKLRKDLKKEGYDGVVVRNSIASPGTPDYWVAFATEQVKSAISGSTSRHAEIVPLTRGGASISTPSDMQSGVPLPSFHRANLFE